MRVAENGVLSSLSLAWSKHVGDGGAIAIARPLRNSYRSVRDHQSPIDESIFVNCSLSLDCGSCVGAPPRSRLRELSLCGCNLGLEGLDAIIEALVTLPSFKHGTLDLSHNDLPRQSAVLLGKLIRSAYY